MYRGAPWHSCYEASPLGCPWHQRPWVADDGYPSRGPMPCEVAPWSSGRPSGVGGCCSQDEWERRRPRPNSWSACCAKEQAEEEPTEEQRLLATLLCLLLAHQKKRAPVGAGADPCPPASTASQRHPKQDRCKQVVAPVLMAMAAGGAVELTNTPDSTVPIWHDLGQMSVGEQQPCGVAVFTLSANVWVDAAQAGATADCQNSNSAADGVQITFRVLDAHGEVLAVRNVEYAPVWSGILQPAEAANLVAWNTRFPISFELYARYGAMAAGEPFKLQATLTAAPSITAVIVKDLQWSALLWPQAHD